eukprot:CAMPEP_0117759196 /NCGR_PEP_ID=MMETSP0947-20121206/15868_1 /TAXON_ID=44440 /ORGANISM="Chattonella subsalsa, Strain CCMP2191" /LENGTH=287 /DNA_ID=CAMNT_0005579605 /DNA_START=21 /DNA_END=881 /DNA_ORIENTATION=+
MMQQQHDQHQAEKGEPAIANGATADYGGGWGYKPPAEYENINIQEMMDTNDKLLREWEELLKANDYSEKCHDQQVQIKNTLSKSFGVLARMADAQIRAGHTGAPPSHPSHSHHSSVPPTSAPAQPSPASQHGLRGPPNLTPQQQQQAALASLGARISAGAPAQQPPPQQSPVQQSRENLDPLMIMLQRTKDQLAQVPEEQRWAHCVNTALRIPENDVRIYKALVELSIYCLTTYNLALAAQAQDGPRHNKLRVLASAMAYTIQPQVLAEATGCATAQAMLRRVKIDW